MTDMFGHAVKETRKNFSRNNLGQRRAGDFYQTPPSMTRQFLQALPVKAFPILEPAEGAGAMARVIQDEYGVENIESYDIVQGRDFLHETRRFPTVITNPPFSLSTEFIRKAMAVATRRISLLMPIDYLHGQERYREIYAPLGPWALTSLHVYVRRAMLTDQTRPDGCYETGMVTWAWYTWTPRRLWTRAPRIFWIDNDAYVARRA